MSQASGGTRESAVAPEVVLAEIREAPLFVDEGTAMTVCRELIDSLKVAGPLWRHQILEDGTDEGVGTP